MTLVSTSLLEDLGIADTPPSEARLVSATIASHSADVALFEFFVDGKTRKAFVPKSEFPAKHVFDNGDTCILELSSLTPRPVLSMSSTNVVQLLIESVSPEVRSGIVRIVDVARAPGLRSKVLVATTQADLDPVAACVGRAANRVAYVKDALLGERVDIIAYNTDKVQLIKNALAPASVTRVELSESGLEATAYVPRHQMAAAVGGNGLNSSLASKLCGVELTVAPATEEQPELP